MRAFSGVFSAFLCEEGSCISLEFPCFRTWGACGSWSCSRPFYKQEAFTDVLEASIKELAVLPLIGLTLLFGRQLAEFHSVVALLFSLFILCPQSFCHVPLSLKPRLPHFLGGQGAAGSVALPPVGPPSVLGCAVRKTASQALGRRCSTGDPRCPPERTRWRAYDGNAAN